MKPVHIFVKLWVKNARFMDFAKFENSAFAIMDTHGGKAISIEKNHTSIDARPHETHILEFPNMSSFEAYRADPALKAMAALRESCIARTEVTIYGDFDT